MGDGRFKKGEDARRHQFTEEERRRGGEASRAAGKGKDFQVGEDERRHKLTREECSRGGVAGFSAMMAKGPSGRKVRAKIYRHYGKNENGTFVDGGSGI